MQRSGPRFDDLYDQSISPLSRINTINEGNIAVPDRCVCVCVCVCVFMCINNDLASIRSTTTLPLPTQFFSSMSLHNIRLEYVTSEAEVYPKITDRMTYSRQSLCKYQTHKCFVMCFGEK
jgi:hypothetical protein